MSQICLGCRFPVFLDMNAPASVSHRSKWQTDQIAPISGCFSSHGGPAMHLESWTVTQPCTWRVGLSGQGHFSCLYLTFHLPFQFPKIVFICKEFSSLMLTRITLYFFSREFLASCRQNSTVLLATMRSFAWNYDYFKVLLGNLFWFRFGIWLVYLKKLTILR